MTKPAEPDWAEMASAEKVWTRKDNGWMCRVGHLDGIVSSNWDGIVYGSSTMKKWEVNLDGKDPSGAEAWARKQVEAEIDDIIARHIADPNCSLREAFREIYNSEG